MRKTLNEIRLNNIKNQTKKDKKVQLKATKELKKDKINFFKKLKKDVVEAIKNNRFLFSYNCYPIFNFLDTPTSIIENFLIEQKIFSEFTFDVKSSYLRNGALSVQYVDIFWRLKDDQIQTS